VLREDPVTPTERGIAVPPLHFSAHVCCGEDGRETVQVTQLRRTLVSPAGVAPSRMVGVSASVGLPLHHRVQKLFSGTGSAHPGGPGKGP